MYRDICNLENIKMDRAIIKEEDWFDAQQEWS